MANWWSKLKAEPDKYLLAVLVLLLPFERIPSLQLLNITLRPSLVVGGLIILRGLYVYLRHRQGIHWRGALAVLALFGLWTLVLVPRSLNQLRGLEVWMFTAFVLGLSVSVALLYRRHYLPLLVRCLLVSAAAVSFFGLWQFVGSSLSLPSSLTGLASRYSWQVFGFSRVQSVALEPLYFASYLLLPASMALALLL